MTDGTLDTTGAKPAVRLSRYLPDPPAVVWRAITEREQLKAWFPCDVVVDGGRWAVGAAITFPFPADVIDMTLTGTVLAVDEPWLLSYTWGEDEVLRFELSLKGLAPGWSSPTSCRRAGRRGTRRAGRTAWTGWPGRRRSRTRGGGGSRRILRRSSRSSGRRRGRPRSSMARCRPRPGALGRDRL